MWFTRILLVKLLFFCFYLNRTTAQSDFFQDLADSAYALTKQRVFYDPGYYVLDYPCGDIPADRGVCTDVIIRAYRKLGVDLQVEVHEDMAAHFEQYPNLWGLTKPDKNIDHRRVPNLMKYFERHGLVLPISQTDTLYKAGDIVCWNLGNNLLHIGLVSHQIAVSGNPLIIHNIGGGQVAEDMLFDFDMIGHYRYQPTDDAN